MGTAGDGGRYLPTDDALTRSELLAMRGKVLPSTANGHAPEPVVEAPGDTMEMVSIQSAPAAPAVNACRECGTALSGSDRRKWCSTSCRKKHQRLAPKAAPSAPPVPVKGRQIVAGLSPVPLDLLGGLSALSAQLPPAWRAEVGAGSVVLSWSSHA